MTPRFSEQRPPEIPYNKKTSFPLNEYASVRAELPEHLQTSVDLLRDEVMDICAAHGVYDLEKLGQEGTKPSVETLERLQALVERIYYILVHKELPPKNVEREPVDDRERVIPLEHIDLSKMRLLSSDLSIYDYRGRFYLLSSKADPPCFYDQEGDKHVLPKKYFYHEIVSLGSQPVLLAGTEREDMLYFITDLEGERLDPPGTFSRWKSVGNQITDLSPYNLTQRIFFHFREIMLFVQDESSEVRHRLQSSDHPY